MTPFEVAQIAAARDAAAAGWAAVRVSQLAAAGTMGAIALTAILALLAWTRDGRLRAASAHSAVLIAERMSTRLHLFLDEVEKQGGPTTNISSHEAKMLLAVGELQELMAGMTDLRAGDLPTYAAADAYVSVRIVTRAVDGILSVLATTPGSAANLTADILSWRRANGAAFTTLNHPHRLRARLASRLGQSSHMEKTPKAYRSINQ